MRTGVMCPKDIICQYVNRNRKASSVSCKLLMYADDIVLLVSDKYINTV